VLERVQGSTKLVIRTILADILVIKVKVKSELRENVGHCGAAPQHNYLDSIFSNILFVKCGQKDDCQIETRHLPPRGGASFSSTLNAKGTPH
jgi:hypothetical protein